jgi:hypothetical protein
VGIVIDIQIARIEHHGNGAREAMLDHILETGCTREDGLAWVDFTLADLWARGFKVVPVE